MIYSIFIQLYVNILIYLNLLYYCTALESQILAAANLINLGGTVELQWVSFCAPFHDSNK